MDQASVLDERSWNLLVQRLHGLGYTAVSERPIAGLDDMWLVVSDVLEDVGLLDAVIWQYCRTKRTTRIPLAASMIGKAVLGWMTATTVVSWSLFATIPYLDPANLAVRMVGGVPVEMTVVQPRYLVGEKPRLDIHAETVADCVMRWSATIIEALHLRSRAGTRAFWGTVALQSRAPSYR
ncbi:hypothetical protein ACHMZP_32140 [Rhodococcus baikonurensis]|uniref:hypothetical protein n=1 Tax=Rhodococcus baikonurensis TaxID=172041 RepID=UPI00378BAF34